MGKIGYGYGSEWHLLRHLGYHREYLSQEILKETGGISIEWMDIGFSKSNIPLRDDDEFVGLDFIKDPLSTARTCWKTFWPQTGNAQNWDAVAKIRYDDHDEWLLVEAKGHTGEVQSRCGAKDPTSKKMIEAALDKASVALGNLTQPITNWLEPYYQYANRLAVLNFLMNECKPAVKTRLLFIYFYGENRGDAVCPSVASDWIPVIANMNHMLGVDLTSPLAKRIHHLIFHVNPSGTGPRSKLP